VCRHSHSSHISYILIILHTYCSHLNIFLNIDSFNWNKCGDIHTLPILWTDSIWLHIHKKIPHIWISFWIYILCTGILVCRHAHSSHILYWFFWIDILYIWISFYWNIYSNRMNVYSKWYSNVYSKWYLKNDIQM